MPGTFPSTPAPDELVIRSVQPTRVSTTHSMQRKKRASLFQRWSVELAWRNINRSEMASIIAFCLEQDGQAGTFDFVMPAHSSNRGSYAGTPLVNGASQTGTSINIDGFTPSGINVSKEMDYIKFTGDDKVYAVTQNLDADGLGQGALTIRPRLLQSPADDSALIHSGVAFIMSLASDLIETPVRAGNYYDFQISLVEDV